MKFVFLFCLISASATSSLADQQPASRPRVRVVDAHHVALRFNPRLPHDRRPATQAVAGKLVITGKVDLTYRVPVPEFVEAAQPDLVVLIAQFQPVENVHLTIGGIDAAITPFDASSAAHFSAQTHSMPELALHIESQNGLTIFAEDAGPDHFDPELLIRTKDPLAKPPGWSTEEQSGTPLPPIKPLLDYAIRDTSVALGPDGIYYLTGTTGSPDINAVTSDVQVWKSPDLVKWSPVVDRPRLRSIVWNVDRDGTWQKQIGQRDGAPFRPVWGPEIHYLKNTFWMTYSVPNLGVGLLKSTTGKAEGPYVSILKPDQPLANGIDASLFQDDDGAVYFLYGGGRIARMKDDMSGLAEDFHNITPSNAPYVGFEGVSMFKANGRYYLAAADFAFGDYNSYVASADKVYGPYGDRYLAVPHAGHDTFFQDKTGQWWSTFFGNDPRAPIHDRPGLLKVKFDQHGRIHPLE